MRIRVDKKKWYRTIAIVNGILLVLLLACLAVMGWMKGQLPSLKAADRWQGGNEMRFAQVACFLREDQPKTVEDIWQFRRNLDGKLVEASIPQPETGKLYQDAWSSRGTVEARGSHGKAQTTAIGVGGEFFLFHPLQLRCGAYLSEQDLMKDRVLLDEDLAWQLFGSWDVAGMPLTIGGRPFVVGGVVHREDDFASRKAYRDGPGLFMAHEALSALTEAGITNYEIVLPDLISGFGLGLVQEGFGLEDGVVENSTRYSVKNLLQVAGDFGVRSMGLSGVIYPYWENAVRLTEDWLSLLLIFALLFALIPVITAVVVGIRLLVRGWKGGSRRIRTGSRDLVERRREARYAEKMKESDRAGV